MSTAHINFFIHITTMLYLRRMAAAMGGAAALFLLPAYDRDGNHRRDHNDRNNCAYHAIARGNGLICRRFLCERLLLNGLRLGDARFLLGLRRRFLKALALGLLFLKLALLLLLLRPSRAPRAARPASACSPPAACLRRPSTRSALPTQVVFIAIRIGCGM